MSKKKAVKVKKDKKQVVIAVIQRAHDLLAKRNGWTKGLYARDAKQQHVGTLASTACSFCAVGSIRRGVYDVTGKKTDHLLESAAYDALWVTLGGVGVTFFNDDQKTKRPVLNLFKKTLLRLEKAA